MLVIMTSDEFEIGVADGDAPPCPSCQVEMTSGGVIDIGLHTYIGKTWECHEEECDLHYVPNEQ